MIVCDRCGLENEPDATFCANPDCNTFLQWDDPPAAEDRAHKIVIPVVDDRPAVATEVRRGVQASLVRRDLRLEAGSQGALELNVRNTGTIIDEFVIEVAGACAPWTAVDPPSLSLFPGAAGSARLVFSPPRSPDTPAGPVAFKVRVTSKVDGSVSAVDAWTVTVGGFRTVAAELSPQTVRSRARGSYRFRLTNTGNLPVTAAVGVVEGDGRLQVSMAPETLRAGPREEAVAVVRAQPLRKVWFGTPVQHGFAVVAHLDAAGEADGPPAAPLRADGTMVQLPVFPKWLLYAAGALIAAAIGVFALTRPQAPPVAAPIPAVTPPPSPTVALPSEAVIPQVNPLPLPAPAPAPVPAPVPAPPPPPPPPPPPETKPEPEPVPKVPNVAGLQESDAVSSLREAGLTPAPVLQASNTVREGRAITTDPKAETELAPGSAVTLFVSAGPNAPVDLVAAAPGATWSSGAGALVFGQAVDPTVGFARESAPVTPGTRALETKPDDAGNLFVQGVYTLPAPLIAGDRFTSGIAFTPVDTTSQVTFEVIVVDATGQPQLVARDDSADGLEGFDIDLTELAGAQAIALRVRATGTVDPAPAIWIDPMVRGA